ncbi:type II toxin-antitoxin system VapC family toxin [Pseudaminobacter sp. 19-2017]|uniref:Ribonuclease VapC n=1 Tax=Pseudaminobacter soli (ex Zhang et al. 2022) TaxID=2831468 RepID=A0A942I8B1_9HYPH|nr:type II toxin-antitoxin system VapC family toxin [Pseudaminobacter soli]
MIVLDTHALIWWLSPKPSKLSRRASEIIEQKLLEGEVVASAISAWEIAMLVTKGKLELSVDVMAWLEAAAEVEGFRFVPVDTVVAVKSQMLPGIFHPDPADRMIVALAREYGAPLVTADGKITEYPHVTTIW